MKLAVEVMDGYDLMPKDGQGSVSSFVEVAFEGQRCRTQTKPRDLNPAWNETLLFDVPDPAALPDRVVDVTVFHDRGAVGVRSLGRVRVSGVSVAPSPSDAAARRCPLEKRGFFSNIRGEIALRLYALPDPSSYPASSSPPPAAAAAAVLNPPSPAGTHAEKAAVAPDPTSAAELDKPEERDEEKPAQQDEEKLEVEKDADKPAKKDEEKSAAKMEDKAATVVPATEPSPEKEPPPPSPPATHYSYSFPALAGGAEGIGVDFSELKMAAMSQSREKPTTVVLGEEKRADYARAEPATVVHMHAPPPRPPQNEFSLVETRPPVAARLGYGGDKISSTFDLVEQMYFLYVNVVKGRDLPSMDVVAGSLDPYVEVKLGNYKGRTRHLVKNKNPRWGQVFAFSGERLQSSVLEVAVKDKDVVKDDLVGRVLFDVAEAPLRLPPDSPLAPQWYRLEDKKGEKLAKGEVMLAVWMGTQADEAFPDAWHSDAHGAVAEGLVHTRSKVYFSPRLCYLRVHVIEAQDLVPPEKGRVPDAYVRMQLGSQVKRTRPSAARSFTAAGWNEEHIFVAAEPFEEPLVITVEDRVGPGKDETMGKLVLPVENAQRRLDHGKFADPRWFSLQKPGSPESAKEDQAKFASKIHLRLCLDTGYHVLDESTHYSSDFRPGSRSLWKPSIGVLELGILGGRNLAQMKAGSGRSTDAYCVAKYGPKWVRTRTLLDTVNPRWNEQYVWEVYDPCTVVTVGVFDNCHLDGAGGKDGDRDQRIGKVRIRLSTLETDRVYTHLYPLVALHTASGVKKAGELHLAVRFTCTAWVNMVALYGRPLLPKMHYLQPIPVNHIDYLRQHAMQMVAARLGRAEPPLRREAVEYLLDVDSHMWSLRRSKANFYRITSLLSVLLAVKRWVDGVCHWKNPATTVLVHLLFFILVWFPELILPTAFLYLFMIGVWNYRFRPRQPPHVDVKLSQAETVHPDELDEEADTFPTARPQAVVQMRYERLRSVAGRVQTVVGDLATQGERAQALLSWRDPRATAIFVILSLLAAAALYVTPFQVVMLVAGVYLLRHPRFRAKTPSVAFNFYRRLPAKSDMLL